MEEELQGGSSSMDPNIPGDGCACWQGPGICAHSRPVSTTVAPGNITALHKEGKSPKSETKSADSLLMLSRAARETKSSPALGIYDMTNPLDSWAFVQFVLSLQDQVNAIASVMGAPEVRDFCWRLDHVNPIADIDNNRYHRSVVHWLSRCPSQFEDAPLSSSASDMPYDGSEEHFQIALKPLLIRDWGWDMLTSDVPSSKSVLFERWVEIIPRAAPSREFTSYNVIRSMISLYDDLTKSSFLPKWNFENPNTDAKCSVFLRPKLNQLLMCHNEKLCLVQSEGRSHVLDNDLAAIVEDRLDLILLSTTWDAPTDTGCHHNERIDRHHIWNLLVTSFYAGHDEAIGHEIRFDVDIRLSRNRLTDLLQDTANQNQPLANVKTTVDLFAHNMTRRAWDYIERETRYYMYVNAVRVKREEERAWANEDRDYACCSWSRSTQEPLYGTCDIVTLRHAFVKVPRPVDHGVVSLPFPADLTFLTNPAETVIDNECLSSGSPEPLLLPTILFVSQQPGHDRNSASNRLRIFLTSAVDMYAHLGIKDLPVWGVYIMCNMTCNIILAFRSSEDDETFIFDDKPHSYNLSDPFSALQFAIFLLRIRKESPPLRVPHPTYPMESDPNPPSDWVEAPLVVENNCGFASVPWSKWTNASQDPVPDAFRVPLEAPRVLRLSMSTETLYKYCEA
ncbi:hypothetical protein QCA50_008347 [Cerrena zonata]|uniref:Uncharacterized protein n=1 Tax=Cerrena zonata TaxID=2478898 RepID=A0AAW0G8P9_9APHY